MVKEKLNIGILYLCIHKKLEERIGISRIYPKKGFYRLIGETFHVPKNMRVCVQKEMEKMGLIKEIGTKKNNDIEVLQVDFDLEKDSSKFYEWLGLWGEE